MEIEIKKNLRKNNNKNLKMKKDFEILLGYYQFCYHF